MSFPSQDASEGAYFAQLHEKYAPKVMNLLVKQGRPSSIFELILDISCYQVVFSWRLVKCSPCRSEFRPKKCQRGSPVTNWAISRLPKGVLPEPYLREFKSLQTRVPPRPGKVLASPLCSARPPMCCSQAMTCFCCCIMRIMMHFIIEYTILYMLILPTMMPVHSESGCFIAHDRSGSFWQIWTWKPLTCWPTVEAWCPDVPWKRRWIVSPIVFGSNPNFLESSLLSWVCKFGYGPYWTLIWPHCVDNHNFIIGSQKKCMCLQ